MIVPIFLNLIVVSLLYNIIMSVYSNIDKYSIFIIYSVSIQDVPENCAQVQLLENETDINLKFIWYHKNNTNIFSISNWTVVPTPVSIGPWLLVCKKWTYKVEVRLFRALDTLYFCLLNAYKRIRHASFRAPSQYAHYI